MMAQQQEEAVDPEVLEAANILMLMFNSGSNSKQQIDPSPLECSTVQRGREVTANESGSSLNLRPGGCGEGCRGSDDPLTLTLPSTSKQDSDDVKVKLKKPKPKPKYRGNKKIHQCGECGEIFEYGQQLGGHMRKHYTGELKPKRKKQKTEVKSDHEQGRGNSNRLTQHANNYNQQLSSNLQQNFMVYNSNQHEEVGCNTKLDLNKVPIEYEMENLNLMGEEESKKKERKAEVNEEKQEKQRQQLSSNLQQDFMVYSNRHHELGCNLKVILNKTPLEYEIEKISLNGEEENKKEERKIEVDEGKLEKKDEATKERQR